MARDLRTNRRIRAREVRVVGPNAEQLGVLPVDEALRRAQEAGMDLVEVNPMSKPPVCKIMDYGKFKYEEKKRASEAKKKQVVVHLKEVKLRPKTEDHDYDFKVRNVKRFLEEGNKARVTIMFRGREITHREIGQRILDDVVKDVKDVGVVEQMPRMEGRQMFMILAPNPKVAARAREQARLAAVEREKKDARPPLEGAKAEAAAEAAAEAKAQAAAAGRAEAAEREAAGRAEAAKTEAAPEQASATVPEAAPEAAAGAEAGTK